MMRSGLTVETLEASTAAAISMSEAARICRRRVFDLLVAVGQAGLTDEQMQIALQMKGNTQRPRRIELFRMGLIVLTGTYRPTLSGRDATVWVAVPGAIYEGGE